MEPSPEQTFRARLNGSIARDFGDLVALADLDRNADCHVMLQDGTRLVVRVTREEKQ